MRKLKLASQLSLGFGVTAIAAAAVCVAVFDKNHDDIMQYKQEVNVNSYTSSKKKTPAIPLFPHNYHSIEYNLQKYYWVETVRENVRDLVYNSTTSKLEVKHLYQDISEQHPEIIEDKDVTLDRFSNVFYPNGTKVCVYLNDGEEIKESYYYADQSIVTTWTSQNGFAYISNIDFAFETQADRDAYKKQHTQEEYDAALKEYNEQANTFYQVFAGSRDAAEYFFQGIKKLGGPDGKGINDKNFTIETAKVTQYTITKFVDWLIQSYPLDNITMDLSQLFLRDLERDNSVLALLNPQLWEYILLQCKERNVQIANIDLSYNNLRVVPNIASIRNKTDSEWLWKDATYDAKMCDVYENNEERPTFANEDGYFYAIDLSNNNLTYFDFSAYNSWTDKESNIKNPEQGSKRVPGLTTLVKCRYRDSEDEPNYRKPIEIASILNPDDVVAYSDKYAGVNLDYNHLAWMLFEPLSEDSKSSPEYVWWMPMLNSWPGMKLKEDLGIDYVLSCARSYMTYTVANIKSETLGGMLTTVEYILGLGVYQTDGVNYTSKEIYNYIMWSDEDFGRNLILNNKAKKVTDKDARKLGNDYIAEFLHVGELLSCPLNRSIVMDSAPLNINPHLDPTLVCADGLNGDVFIPLKYEMARVKYLPDSFDIDKDTSLNEIASKILGTAQINYFTTFTIPGFEKDYSTAIGVGVGLGAFVLLLIVIVIIKLVGNVKHQFEYRRNELDAELSEGNAKENKDKNIKKLENKNVKLLETKEVEQTKKGKKQ